MTAEKVKNAKMIVLFIIGLLFFNFPLLSIFSGDGMLFNVPVLYAFIYIFWAFLIGITRLIARGRNKNTSSHGVGSNNAA